LDLIILVHIWALAPLAYGWLLFPHWRARPNDPVTTIAVLDAVVTVYLLIRTWVTLRGPEQRLVYLWPWVDAGLVTVTLLILQRPTDVLATLYLIPIAEAAGTLKPGYAAGLAVASGAGYLAVAAHVVGRGRASWDIALVFQLAIVLVLASLYGAIIRVATDYVRTVERAAFQRELALEIHDGVQYLLVAMASRLELAGHLVTEAPARAAQIIAAEREVARRALDELRYLVRRLRASPQAADLATALRHQVADLANRWSFDLHLDLPVRLPRLTPAAEHAVLRMIQETLTNAAKHAQAKHVTVRMRAEGRQLVCVVEDDGIGFDPAATSGVLDALHERARTGGGTLEVWSAPGQGTRITATFPALGGRA
jgi:signal transduction histidine kinase